MAKKNRIPHPLIALAKREIEGTISYYGLCDRSQTVEPPPSRPLRDALNVRDALNARFWNFQRAPRAGEGFNEAVGGKQAPDSSAPAVEGALPA
jgi:hypothetical protein